MLCLFLLIPFLPIQLKIVTIFPVNSYHSIFFILIFFTFWFITEFIYSLVMFYFTTMSLFKAILFYSILRSTNIVRRTHGICTLSWVDIYHGTVCKKHCNSITKLLGDSEISFVVKDKNEKQIQEIFQ